MTATTSGRSARVREVAVRKYVLPNTRRRQAEFSIPVRALLEELKQEGFPAGNTPQVCSAIQSRKFLTENNLLIAKVEGPPSGQSTRVVIHYRFQQSVEQKHEGESAERRAIRIARESAGLLQPAIDQFGSPAALLRWIRSEDEA